MKKILLATIILLIIVTSLVKNSTKEIEDQTFSLNENIRTLKSELGDLILEYNYLSAPEKLIEYQSQYFKNDLKKIDIKKMRKIILINNNLETTDFKIKTNNNE
jgi:cell division protein FtsL